MEFKPVQTNEMPRDEKIKNLVWLQFPRDSNHLQLMRACRESHAFNKFF